MEPELDFSAPWRRSRGRNIFGSGTLNNAYLVLVELDGARLGQGGGGGGLLHLGLLAVLTGEIPLQVRTRGQLTHAAHLCKGKETLFTFHFVNISDKIYM